MPPAPSVEPPTDHDPADSGVDVVRHEEIARLRTRVHPTERVRLKRVVVTEQRTITVDIRREEIRLLREPITDDDDVAVDGPAAERDPIVVVLHEEQVVITKTVVPVERVTLRVRAVTADSELTQELRRERIDIEGFTDAV